ncbi:MAG: type II toxin-antitoxin system RelE/ParE family toxin [Bacteroidaceae bacterium]|nr:type II toxin-antitoxin system RelE/ParE family toxin [Bacteroidaceae bacterium]
MSSNRKYFRQILPFKEYFKDFKKTLAKDVLMKIYQVFLFIMTEERVPVKFLRNIEGVKDLYEIRVEHQSNIYRIFCCFDEGNLVILFNAFQKKTQKTPPNEIERAKRIKDEYFKAKESLKKRQK